MHVVLQVTTGGSNTADYCTLNKLKNKIDHASAEPGHITAEPSHTRAGPQCPIVCICFVVAFLLLFITDYFLRNDSLFSFYTRKLVKKTGGKVCLCFKLK